MCLLPAYRTRQASNTRFFFFNDTATTEIYTLSLHDALPIWLPLQGEHGRARGDPQPFHLGERADKLVGDTVTQVLVFRIGAAVHERQHRERAGLADERRGGAPRVRGFQRRHELLDVRESVRWR